MFGFSLKPVNSFSSFFLLSLANSETKRRDILGFVKTGDPGPLSQISWSSKGQLYEGQLPGGGGGGTHCRGLYGDAPPERDIFFGFLIYKRGGIKNQLIL